MKRVMGYCDRWSVAPGETVRFMVSCLEGDRYNAQIVRLKQPDAGPLATPFAPEPVDAPCNGSHAGRRQAIPIGSLAAVPPRGRPRTGAGTPIARQRRLMRRCRRQA